MLWPFCLEDNERLSLSQKQRRSCHNGIGKLRGVEVIDGDISTRCSSSQLGILNVSIKTVSGSLLNGRLQHQSYCGDTRGQYIDGVAALKQDSYHHASSILPEYAATARGYFLAKGCICPLNTLCG